MAGPSATPLDAVAFSLRPLLLVPFPWFLSMLVSCLSTAWSCEAAAEIRVVHSQGDYRMGDRDTKEDAVRLALEAAKRGALEQVATYLESVTVIEGSDITRDEIRTYSAGLVLVLDQHTSLSLDGDTVVITVDLTSQVDTEEVVHAIAALRENEDARRQLAALREEEGRLLQELDAATRALATAWSSDQVQQASQQRREILNHVQSNAMVAQVWTDWVIVSPVMYPYPPPRTLNQWTHHQPTSPQLGNQPARDLSGIAASSLKTHDSRLNPLLPSAGATPPEALEQSGSRSLHAMLQFLQPPTPPSPAGGPPAARRLLPHQAPHVLHQVAPRLSGGGGQGGPGMRGGGRSGGRGR